MTALEGLVETVVPTTADFARLAALFERATGIRLGPEKHALVTSRLQHRLRQRSVRSFRAYLELLEAAPEVETPALVEALTTHETSFYREATHFEVLAARARQARGVFRVWSAACSTGEEASTLALVLAGLPGLRWEVLGTDVAPDTVRRAAEGIFPLERGANIPLEVKRRHCLRGVGVREGTFCLRDELRERLRFQVANLLEPQPQLGQFDAALVRNVLIYFDPQRQKQILGNVVRQLKPGGLLVVGHAESAAGVPGLRRVDASIYEAAP